MVQLQLVMYQTGCVLKSKTNENAKEKNAACQKKHYLTDR